MQPLRPCHLANQRRHHLKKKKKGKRPIKRRCGFNGFPVSIENRRGALHSLPAPQLSVAQRQKGKSHDALESENLLENDLPQ